MNKIVLEHYPVDKLPDDLRSAVPGHAHVRVTLDVSGEATSAPSPVRGLGSILQDVAGMPGSDLSTAERNAARARIARWAGAARDETMTTEKAVARIRSLREEGED